VLVLWNGRVRTDTVIRTQTTVASGRVRADVATAGTVGLPVLVNHPKHYDAGNCVPVMVVCYAVAGCRLTGGCARLLGGALLLDGDDAAQRRDPDGMTLCAAGSARRRVS